MQIAHQLLQKIFNLLLLTMICFVPVYLQSQTTQSNQNNPSAQAKKAAIVPLDGSIQILSDTQGVDFGRYMKQLRATVEDHWNLLIPAEAQPPISKPGTAVIEFAIMKDGKLDAAMKLVKSADDYKLNAAAWGAILNSVPLPKFPAEFKGDSVRMRATFIYNGPVIQAPLVQAKPSDTK